MKKYLVLLLVLLISFTGCKKEQRQLDEEKYNAYLTYYQSILETDYKTSSSPYFDIDVVVNQVDNYYRYDVIIDNPRIAMMNIKALAIVDGMSLVVDTDNMMPSIGIIDDTAFCMVPGQIDKSRNYVGGIYLTLYSEDSALSISVMVDWRELTTSNTHREYVSIYREYQPVAEETENQ